MANQPPPPPVAEETPSGIVSPSASHTTLINMDSATSSQTQIYGEPREHENTHSESTTRPRANSSVSRVDLRFFDPDGVGELRRTLTKQGKQEEIERARTHGPEDVHDPEQGRFLPGSFDETLNSHDEPFDFQKTLDRVIRMYVFMASAKLFINAFFFKA
jgi:hypothetical protein